MYPPRSQDETVKPSSWLKTMWSFLWRFVLFAISTFGLGIGLCFLVARFYSQPSSAPPGYKDSFDIWTPSHWDTESIGHFLNLSLPEDATELWTEGSKGLLGSLGIIPRLAFSFRVPVGTAEGFIENFCNGVFHTGYNPLIAINSAVPTTDSVLIRVDTNIHYSRSPRVSHSIRGNRCMRIDERGPYRTGAPFRYLEEWVMDTSDPAYTRISYRLPYPNVAHRLYPRANFVTPTGAEFRLRMTGLRHQMGSYILEYPTVCLETANMSVIHQPELEERMQPYVGADVAVSFKGIPQPRARIGQYGHLVPDSQMDVPIGLLRWQYCLDSSLWEPGQHTMVLQITPPEGDVLAFSLTIYVPSDHPPVLE